MTKTVAIFLFSLVVAIGFMIALIANPQWGTPLLVVGTIAELGSGIADLGN